LLSLQPNMYTPRLILLVIIPIISAFEMTAQSIYFPPAGDTWETLSPDSLNWCPERIDSLESYLSASQTKAFIVLKDGKIVLEDYFGTFTQDSLWFWASAGKSLSSVLVGIAQEEGFLQLDDLTSDYLGTGWTSCTPEQEALITIRKQISMTSGLDDGVPDDNCEDPACLVYTADAGTRWAYHNAPYTLVQEVVANATAMSYQQWTNTRVKNKIGMSSGIWYDNIFYSKARDMARFGLLCLSDGTWDGTAVLSDQQYLTDMKNSSQTLNPSYGYLWWLNGKGSYMLPTLQLVFNTDMVPEAPDDMYCALGKYDQKIYVIPSTGMVVIRMGWAAGESLLALSSYDNLLWQKINELTCIPDNISEESNIDRAIIYPNPAKDQINIANFPNEKPGLITIYSCEGKNVLQSAKSIINVSGLSPGMYQVKIQFQNSTSWRRLMIE
jgi:CubicO group peptidase (beta-lactamase class C family)